MTRAEEMRISSMENFEAAQLQMKSVGFKTDPTKQVSATVALLRHTLFSLGADIVERLDTLLESQGINIPITEEQTQAQEFAVISDDLRQAAATAIAEDDWDGFNQRLARAIASRTREKP